MNTLEKAKILSRAGNYDSCGPKMCEVNVHNSLGGIYHAKAEHKTCRIFKTLMDNHCSFDCAYCSNSSKCIRQRVKYEPKELANLFMHLHKNLNVNGLFLSSGVVKDPDPSYEKMLDTIKILRYQYKFRGYIHMKVLPGTSYDLVKQGSKLASRMSINIEAPTRGELAEYSSCKDFKIDILRRQGWIKNLNLSGGQATQVILHKDTTDHDVLKMSDWEYKKIELRRMYYSAFSPVKGTPLESKPKETLLRQNRLYNCDFLMRCYGYKVKEFDNILNKHNMLPKEDPKIAIARSEFEGRIDINEADYDQLIRIPGIGLKTAQRIISWRENQKNTIRSYSQLHSFGSTLHRAKPFISIGGKKQMTLGEF